MLNDPRMHQLMQANLSDVMKEMLKISGYDLFHRFALTADNYSKDYEKGNMVRFTPLATFERVSRDGYIFTLHYEEGMSVKEIRSKLIRELGIKIGTRQISRVIAKLRPASY